MQPQIRTNKAGQGRPVGAQGCSPAPVGDGRGLQLLWGARGACPYLHQHPSNSSHRSHREKVSFHVKQRNGMNSSIPGKSEVRAAREKLNWKLLTLAAVLLLTRDESRAGQDSLHGGK